MNSSPIFVAQQKLFTKPYDIYHNIFHHYKVWENSREIAAIEKLSPDQESLDIACWWHDIFKGDSDTTSLISALEACSITPEILQKVVHIVEEHSFGQEQTHLESKILFDADKLEYISLARWQLAFDAFEKGIISQEEKDRYVAAWNKRVPGLIGSLHFTYSNQEYERRYFLFVEWLKSIGRYQDEKFI